MAVATNYGALNLYLNFINLFQFLLSIFGSRRWSGAVRPVLEGAPDGPPGCCSTTRPDSSPSSPATSRRSCVDEGLFELRAPASGRRSPANTRAPSVSSLGLGKRER